MDAEAGTSSLPLTLRRLVVSRRGAGPRRIDAATGQPIAVEACVSVKGVQVVPAFVVFHTPPSGIPA